MTKAELVSQIARETGYDKASVLTILECALSDIKKNVAAGENVYVRGFGSFVTIVRKEKIAPYLCTPNLYKYNNSTNHKHQNYAKRKEA